MALIVMHSIQGNTCVPKPHSYLVHMRMHNEEFLYGNIRTLQQIYCIRAEHHKYNIIQQLRNIVRYNDPDPHPNSIYSMSLLNLFVTIS